MKDIIKYGFIPIVIVALNYAAVVFVTLESNPMNWLKIERFIGLLFSLVCVIAYYCKDFTDK